MAKSLGGLMAERVKEGDLVYLEYDAWTQNPGGQRQLFETTSEQNAKDNDLYDEKRSYGEAPSIVGRERLMKGLDEALTGAVVGSEKEVVITPDKGMGERDPKLVELFPIREFHRQEIDPKPGMEVHIRNRHGIVSAVTAGRVRVDFNNPLAGKTLVYTFKVTKKAKGAKAKAQAILEMDYGTSEGFQIRVEKGNAEVVLPEVCKYDEKWFVGKYRVISDLRDLAGLKAIRFIEEYTAKKAEGKAGKAEEETEEAKKEG